MAADFRLMGASVEAEADETSEDVVEIMPANHASFGAFLACQTQWDVVGTPAGLFWNRLIYEAVRDVLDDIAAPRQVFSDLRVMEAEALPILNERDD